MIIDNIHIKYPDKLQAKITAMKSAGPESIHVVSDFDHTLTRAFIEGKKILSTYAVLRDCNYLDPAYNQKDTELFEEYYPIEQDTSISDEIKTKKMEEWWFKHYDLMLKSGVTKDMIFEVSKAGRLVFRKDSINFINTLFENNIPLLIFSAGIGNVIELFLKDNNCNHKNVKIISNFLKFDESGKMIAFSDTLIHSYNKSEVSLKNGRYEREIKNRKNVILLGDVIGDLGMSAGLDHDNIIHIGFLNKDKDRNLPTFEEEFDIVILNDGEMTYVNDIIRDICTI